MATLVEALLEAGRFCASHCCYVTALRLDRPGRWRQRRGGGAEAEAQTRGQRRGGEGEEGAAGERGRRTGQAHRVHAGACGHAGAGCVAGPQDREPPGADALLLGLHQGARPAGAQRAPLFHLRHAMCTCSGITCAGALACGGSCRLLFANVACAAALKQTLQASAWLPSL